MGWIIFWATMPSALSIVFGILVSIGMRFDPSMSNGYPGHQ